MRRDDDVTSLLVGRDLTFGYETPLVQGIHLRVEPGRCLALLGANGAGKTTLLRLLGGLQAPQQGTVTIGDRPLLALDPRERAQRLGYLPQRVPPAAGFAVHEIVLMGLYPLLPARGWESDAEWSAVVEALARVGADDLLWRPFDELSGGEQRRVLLARALVARPPLLLLDEPLAALDPGFAVQLIDTLERIKSDDVGMVIASHRLELVSRLADRVLGLRHGREMAVGTVTEVLTGEVLNAVYGTGCFASGSIDGLHAGVGEIASEPSRSVDDQPPAGEPHPHRQAATAAPSCSGQPNRDLVGTERVPGRLPRGRYIRLASSCLALLIAILVLAPMVGSTTIRLADVWSQPFDWSSNPQAAIFFVARVPRVLLAALVGAALALCGAVYQALLRNPLATPYTLGVAAGATLGVFLAMRWAPTSIGSELLAPGAGLLGAVGTTLVVMGLALRRRRQPGMVLLLAGVTLNLTLGALILMMQYFADHTETVRMVRWMMGDLEGVSYRLLGLIGMAMLPGWWYMARRGRALNLLSLGAEEAAAHGVDPARTTRGCCIWAGWVTGLAVAVAGPVGFVGIVVPHTVRLLGGHDYRVLLPVSLLMGGAFLVLCDVGARTLLAPIELPIGVLTAALGGPFFLWLLLRDRSPAAAGE